MRRLNQIIQSQTVKDTAVSLIGLGVTAVIGFIYTVILARILGPETFGIFSAVTALVAIIYSLGDLGVASALINFIPKQKDQRSALVSTAFWFELFIGFLIIIIFFVLGIFHKWIVPGSAIVEIFLAGFLALNYLLIGLAQGIFTADRKFLTFSISQVVDAVVKIIIVYFLLRASQLTISTAILANIISTILALFITFGKELSAIKNRFDKSIFLRLFGFAKWIAVSKVFSVFISRIDIILLNLLSSSYEAGIFAAASRITLFFMLLVSSLGSVINPRFSSFDSKEKVLSYTKKLMYLIAAVSLMMIASALLAKPIIDVVFGSKYLAAIPVFQALTFAMIPFIFTLATSPAITFSFGQPSFIAYVTAFQVISMIIIELLIIPRFGAFAPPIALGISNTIVFVLSVLKLRQLFSPAKETNRKWTNNSHLLLEQASGLKNYNRWLVSQFNGHIGKNILEVGAGIGALSGLLPKKSEITLSDLRDDYFSTLKKQFKCKVLKLDITDKIPTSLQNKFDTILSSNVFEHIENDLLAFENSLKLLKPGGKLLLFVPARQEIYGQLDDDMGHFRRYQLEEGVIKAKKAGFKIIDAHYANLPGYFTWWGRGVVLGKLIKSKAGNSPIDSFLAGVFDYLIIPLLILERFIRPPVGQSLVLVAQKPID